MESIKQINRRITIQVLGLLMLLMNVANAQEVGDDGSPLTPDTKLASQIIDLEPVDSQRQRTVPIRVYLPTSNRPQPVVLVSHGLGGSRDSKSSANLPPPSCA